MILTQSQIHEMNILVDLVQHCHHDWSLRQMVDFVVSNLVQS
jgi:hypothetical protein